MRNLSKLFAISVGLLAFQSTATFASVVIPNTTIIFHDSTDTLTVTSDDSATGAPQTSTGSCTGETCTIEVFDPANTRGSSTGGVGLPLFILEPGGSSIISDELDAGHDTGLGGYTITFTSDTDEIAGLGTFTPPGDTIVEDGTVQTGFVITWLNLDNLPGASATIEFQSDLDSTVGVPEPSSLPLLLAGLAAIAGALYLARKKAMTA